MKKALNKKTGKYSIIRIVPADLIDERLQTLCEVMRNYGDEFLASYESVMPNGTDLWVRLPIGS